jgi:serine/threonine-protein kinase
MSARYSSSIAFVLVSLVVVAELAYYLPQLPDRLASHFDFAGTANGWSDQSHFILTFALLIALMGAIFVTLGSLHRVPEAIISLPNKTYWLAPERRAATFALVRDWLRWFLVLTLALIALIVGLVLRANLAPPPQLSPFAFGLVIGYVVIAVAMLVTLIRRFRVPPA